MSSMWTVAFWKATAERAISTAAQVALVGWGAGALPNTSVPWWTLPVMALAGAGFGLYQSPNNRTMQASAPRRRSGGASGMQAMARLLGQTVGAALTAFAFARFADGNVAALWFAVGFAALGAIVSAMRLNDMPHPDEPG